MHLITLDGALKKNQNGNQQATLSRFKTRPLLLFPMSEYFHFKQIIKINTLLYISDVPWITIEADLQNHKNSFKKVGFSLTTGNFFNDGISSFATGAPQTDNLLGAVFVCHDCFNSRRR